MFKNKATNMDTSRISITARYTGATWANAGMSYDGLCRRSDCLIHSAFAPANHLAFSATGIDMNRMLLRRHILIDDILRSKLKEYGQADVLELASGYSPRGIRFMDKGSVNQTANSIRCYYESDLPNMVPHKTNLLAQRGQDNARHMALPINILEPSGSQSLEDFMSSRDAKVPMIVISEGISMYFDTGTMERVWQRLATALRGFPAATYISDIIPNLTSHPRWPLIKLGRGAIGMAARGKLTFHYQDDASIRERFAALGFDHVVVHDPDEHVESLGLPRLNVPSIQRIVCAEINSA